MSDCACERCQPERDERLVANGLRLLREMGATEEEAAIVRALSSHEYSGQEGR